MTSINSKELKIMVYYLEEAIADYGDHGCNDLPDNIFRGWTKEEKKELKESFTKWYNSKHDWEFCGGEDFDVLGIPNHQLVLYFLDKYKKEKYCSFNNIPREGWTTVKMYSTGCNKLVELDSDITEFNYCPFCGKTIEKEK